MEPVDGCGDGDGDGDGGDCDGDDGDGDGGDGGGGRRSEITFKVATGGSCSASDKELNIASLIFPKA
ncbi:hypothetical protein E2C01_075338 [Portunus trituberculatus]|uniref:Uncharacterized protein n=1 Tax=Portunus trituberculatus TaxID=210409 RepID=A0A5B7I8A1_PORTR|nr:hypothetical protein [Portunus trituberculatus]